MSHRNDSFYTVRVRRPGSTTTTERADIRAKKWRPAYTFAKALMAEMPKGYEADVMHQTYDGFMFRGLATFRSNGDGTVERTR